jgi:pimeloyl-ACP methyl ester carboxylesterase
VVLDAGAGEMSADWVLVQREVSGTTRVCAYDRAGTGWSETGPEPRDAKRISGELHALLEGAGIESPYVLVGHSFGGLYAQTYAARYAEEVAGVCLVESPSPEQFGHRPAAQDSHEPPTRTFAVASLLARIGVALLLYELVPAPPELPPRQRTQIDAIGPSTRQVSTTALELRAGPRPPPKHAA